MIFIDQTAAALCRPRPDSAPDAFVVAEHLRNETVLQVEGGWLARKNPQ